MTMTTKVCESGGSDVVEVSWLKKRPAEYALPMRLAAEAKRLILMQKETKVQWPPKETISREGVSNSQDKAIHIDQKAPHHLLHLLPKKRQFLNVSGSSVVEGLARRYVGGWTCTSPCSNDLENTRMVQ